MVRVESRRKITPGANGIHFAVMDLQVSTVSELPALNGIIEGMKVQAGSIAEIIQTGDLVQMDASGTWYNCDGTGAVSTVSASVSSTRGGLAKSIVQENASGMNNVILNIEPQEAEFKPEEEPKELPKEGGEMR